MGRSTRLVLGLVAVCVVTADARAGVCVSDKEADDDMAMIEAFAKDRHRAPSHESYAWMCVRLQAPRLSDRIVAACGKILDRDGDASDCVELVAVLGMAKLGAHDIFADVSTRKLEPFDTTQGYNYNLYLLGAVGDPRAVPIIMQAWRNIIPQVDKYRRQPEFAAEWSSWRQTAAAILARIGSGDVLRKFLEDQAAATDDRYVKSACLDAARTVSGKK